MPDIKRREFITLLGGAVVAWPLAARAQKGSDTRRIGVMIALTESDSEGQVRVQAFRQALHQFGRYTPDEGKHSSTLADFSFSIGFGECIGDLAPIQNHQLSSSELTYF